MACDTLYASVIALLHFEGADASTTFSDETGRVWTPVAGAQISTDWGAFGVGASGQFSGSDQLTTSALGIGGTEAFTIEMTLRPSQVVAAATVFDARYAAGRGGLITQPSADPASVQCYFGDADSGVYEVILNSGAASLAADTPAQIAVTRSGSDFSLYLDGTRVATASWAGVIDWNLTVASLANNISPGAGYQGYIDELRITKGVARYTAASYTVPTMAFTGSCQAIVSDASVAADALDGARFLGESATASVVLAVALGSTSNMSTSTTEAVVLADTLAHSTFTLYLEAIGLTDSLAAGANTTSSLADSAVMRDVIQQAINQIVIDTANGTDSLSLGAALTLVDIANAAQTQTSTYNSVMLVAELVATLEAYNGADAYDITESGVLSDAYVNRVQAIFAMIEAAQAVDTNTALIHVMQLATDSADGATSITSAGSLLNSLLTDTALATIRLNIGGELFTGWVLNTDTLAPSEYQFAELQFNSACKHGSRYLMAADDGIYEFTEDTGVETVMTYIKTGKTDFGSDLKKRVVNSYMVYAASGDMVLKVTTSEFGNLVTRNYRVSAQAGDATDTRRVDVGRGIKSRYWQFELVGDGVDCDIDEIGMLPVVLSRRI